MSRGPVAAIAAAILVIVIGGAILLSQRNQPATGGPVMSPSASPSPSLTVSPSPTPSTVAVVLQRAPMNVGCDAIGIDYHSVTMRIDPQSDVVLDIFNPAWDGSKAKVNVDVWAEADTGTRLAVYWTTGFNATNGDMPVIRGLRGEEVARDRSKIDLAKGAYPPLADYFVCPGPESLFILEYQPG